MENYNDIINLPHHKSSTRPHMSNRDRAAQFAPFAALTGHDSAIKETARLTDDFIEISEDKMTALSAKMQMIIENILETPEVEFTYFAPDENKLGGAYISKMGNVRRVDEYDRVVIFTDGVKIPIDSIIDINGEFFSTLD
ncbi:MAG: hypothetical protein GX286_07140 [Clostridiales bacterium]|nr:hypothetical protein [Clostridiales bacterium]